MSVCIDAYYTDMKWNREIDNFGFMCYNLFNDLYKLLIANYS